MPTAEGDAGCDLSLFLKVLAERGKAMVSAGPLRFNAEQALSQLREIHLRASEELAAEAPAFSDAAALWAARLLYHLAQFTVCRDLGEKEINEVCAEICPGPPGPETEWAADLSLRHLPRLFRLARQLSGSDPLVIQMKKIGAAWPLSSVGMSGLEGLDIGKLPRHPALMRLYADRIFAESDISRLGDGRVDDLLRGDLGSHRLLSPAIAEKLFATTDESH